MPVLKLKRRMRVVEGCPQPEPAQYKPIVYGAGPWPKRLPPSPTADEITIRARAQSLMSRNGERAELPDIETARRVIAEHESMPAVAGQAHAPLRAMATAGSNYKEKQ